MQRPALFLTLLTLGAALGVAAPAQAKKPGTAVKAKGPDPVTTDSGLKYLDTVVGTGVSPQRGQRCVVHYTGWLNDGRGQRGKKFDSSLDRGQPLVIPIGVGRVIRGWDEGLLSMKVGGKRTLFVPSYLGYGPRGAGGDIPPNADLIFDVELLGVQ
jgi:peptidylprolyl isomerase